MSINIEVTRDSSFCPGVDRAFNITEQMLFGGKARCYSIGPLIHNPEVVKRLSMLGLEVIDPDSEHLPDLAGMNVVIRSHGIDTATEQKLESLGAVLVDATCPTVKRAQEAASMLVELGYRPLIIGAASHPEVRSIVGRAGGPVTVIDSVEEAKRWAEEHQGQVIKIGIVCQTTISRDLLEAVLAVLQREFKDITVMNTICESVARRQEEANDLAGRVDLMIVAGGRNSSNTVHLAERCRQECATTHLIEDPSEIENDWLKGVSSVGVTGGASTPDWLIQETVERLFELELEREKDQNS
jgi:(E)-4-hydroxy-3-methyl-but-2-enyl pyrophosphate reductase